MARLFPDAIGSEKFIAFHLIELLKTIFHNPSPVRLNVPDTRPMIQMEIEEQEKSYRKVAEATDIPRNSGLKVTIDEEEFALFNLNGEFYAINDFCPHRGASLSEGFLEQDKVFCPLHCFDFNLITGESEIVSHLRVETYQVKVEDGSIFILY